MGRRRSLRRRSCSAGGGEGCVRRSATRRSRITSTSGSSWKRSARWRYSHPCSRETIYRYRTVTQFSGVRSQDISKIRRKHRECHRARAHDYARKLSASKQSDVNLSDARRSRRDCTAVTRGRTRGRFATDIVSVSLTHLLF